MRILFILPAMGKSVDCHLGVAYLSALARKRGHETALLKVERDVSASRIATLAKTAAPDLIAVSVITNHWPQVSSWVPLLRTACPGAHLIVGGVHATVAADAVAASALFDAICVGEGDEAFGAYLDALAGGHSGAGIPNLWTRMPSGDYHRGPVAPFHERLDELPFPDRTLFADRSNMAVLTGRGCPFDCTYCFNHVLKQAAPGPYLRRRSVESVLAEIETETRATTVRRVIFEDDTFTLNARWLTAFCAEYKRRIGLPMVVNGRVGAIDDERVAALADAGCDYMCIGVESGNEHLRRTVLGRTMSNDEIIAAFDLTKRHGLATYAFYMIGFPGETEAMARETLALHRRLAPEAGFQISVLYPYPGTRLHAMAAEAGVLSGRDKATFEGAASTLDLPDLPAPVIAEIVATFERLRYESSFGDRWLAARMPRALPLARLAWRIFGKERLLRWGKAARDRLRPALTLRHSHYA